MDEPVAKEKSQTITLRIVVDNSGPKTTSQ